MLRSRQKIWTRHYWVTSTEKNETCREEEVICNHNPLRHDTNDGKTMVEETYLAGEGHTSIWPQNIQICSLNNKAFLTNHISIYLANARLHNPFS